MVRITYYLAAALSAVALHGQLHAQPQTGTSGTTPKGVVPASHGESISHATPQAARTRAQVRAEVLAALSAGDRLSYGERNGANERVQSLRFGNTRR